MAVTNGDLMLQTMVAAFAAGIMLIVVSRRVQLPAIVLLLLGGYACGPQILGIVRPDSLGGGLVVIVELAVGLILFDGGLTLDGILDVRFLPDYMPAAGDSFQLFVANRIVGEFEQLLLPSLPQGLSYELASINAGLLRIVPEPALPMWGALVGVMAIRRRGARGVMRFGRWR